MLSLNSLISKIRTWFDSPRNNLLFGFLLGIAATLIVGAIV